MRTIMKRVLSIVLACTILVGSVPVSAFAADPIDGNAPSSTITEVEGQTPQEDSDDADTPQESPAPSEETPVSTEETPSTTDESVADAEQTSESTDETASSADAGIAVIADDLVDDVDVTKSTAQETSTQVTYARTNATTGSKTDTDYLFIATDRHANTSIIGNIINNMESVIGENELDYLALGGDMVGSGSSHPAYNSSTVLSEVTGATSSLSATNVDIVAGIHDMNVNDDAGIVLPYSGGGAKIYEGNKFYVYGVPESCISGAVSGVDPETEANDFVTWANGSDIDKSKAIIVVSHYPLHQRRNDNDGAVYWASALNKVAAGDDTTIDRDVAFFWGHNHTGESSADTAVYHVAPNGSISVQGGSSNQKIYFTYANAGYLNAKSSATLVTITDDTITFDKYVNSSVSTTYTVTRVVTAATLTSIEVSGTTEYTVGDVLDLTVTATYDNGTTADVTADATFTPAELTASGTYTVAASYGGMTDTIDVKTYLYDEDDANLIGVEALSQGATALEVTWDDEADAILKEKGLYTDYVVYDLALTNPGETTEYAMTTVEGMDTSNLAVYHIADDGTLTRVSHTIENDCVVFTTSLTGTFAYGSITVPEGYTLASVTMENIPADIFVGTSLNLLNAKITATYTKEGAEDFVRQLTVYDYDETNFSGFDVNEIGKQTAVFTFTDGTKTVSTSMDVYVWGETFTDETTGVIVTVGAEEYGVTSATVTKSEDENISDTVATAVADVLKEGTYVAYDISLTYNNDYSATEETKTVTLPIPENVVNPVVYYVSETGELEKMTVVEKGETTVTFETTHFSTYVVGESSLVGTEGTATVPGASTPTKVATETTVYKLVDTPESGKQYLIVNSNNGEGYGLDGDTTGYTTAAFTGGSDYYSTWDDASKTGTEFAAGSDVYLTTSGAYLWTAGSNSFTIGYTQSTSGGSFGYTEYTNDLDPDNSETAEWILSDNKLSVSLVTTDSWWGSDTNTTYYLSNSGSSWSMGTGSGSNVYFYEPVTIYKVTEVSTGTQTSTYGIDITLDGTATKAITAAFIKEDDTKQLGTAFTSTVDGQLPSGGTYKWSSSNEKVATVDENGLVTFTGADGVTLIQVTYTWTENGNEYTISNYAAIDVTGAIYTAEISKDGTTAAPSVIAQRSVTNGTTMELTGLYTVQTDETTTSTATPDTVTWYVYLEDGSDASSIASIDQTGKLTFTGKEGTVKVMLAAEFGSTTVTDIVKVNARISDAVTPEESTSDFPKWGDPGSIRLNKTASAVGNFSETGIAQIELSMAGIPVGGAVDVYLMLDLSNSVYEAELNDEVFNAAVAFAGSITDNCTNDSRIAVGYFSRSAETVISFADSEDMSWTEMQSTITGISQPSSGTSYTAALTEVKSVLDAERTDGTYNPQFVVFISDGAPTSFTYVSGDSYKTYSKNGQPSDSDISALPNYTEYYTNTMKNYSDPVTVFTIGLNLSSTSNPNALAVLKNMATDEKKYANVESGQTTAQMQTNLEEILEAFSGEIKSAASNVTVEDIVTDEYEIIFELPNSAIEGLPDGQEFYIEAVDYPLDETTHERTGVSYTNQRIYLSTTSDGKVYISKIVEDDLSTEANDTSTVEYTVTDIPTPVYTAKEKDTDKAYFDASGNYYPNGDGTHHMTSGAKVELDADGNFVALHTRNFTYLVAEKKLNWTSTSMSKTSESALRYFVYLENSGGVDPSNQVDAGTYPTNEYAKITYTNHRGTKCEQYFPVPQMTWNGAQVSYVFYLVNENGKPVNRAGGEVTFSEAIFVTDVHTYAITWNDLEQAAGLEAERLALNLIPSDYSLYDSSAVYKIHVYEDENEVNLNNHFVIEGNEDLANPETTYVYNNKTDIKKYNEIGTYAENKTYMCKGENAVSVTVDADGVVTAASYTTATGETQKTFDTKPTGADYYDGTYAYYLDENNEWYTIVTKSDATAISGFDFANTTVAFAVVWERKMVDDTIVVDYGLPVDIDVVKNDFVYNYINGISSSKPYYAANIGYQPYGDTYSGMSAKALNIGGHSAEVMDENTIRFYPGITTDSKGNITKTMEFDEPVSIYYETTVEAYENEKVVEGAMYAKLTVIPATTVYYEDTFVTLSTEKKVDSGWTSDDENAWTTVGTAINATQAQDRPGESQISASLDADNNYGYDSAYETMATYSMGSAAMVNVCSGHRAKATFDFYGTGFDVISLTSNTTGTITVTVKDENGVKECSYVVDTYYGYAYKDGEWVAVDTNNPNALYQVPVMKIDGLDYGKHSVEINAAYASLFDHEQYDNDSYDFYLDAIRIYDPTGNINDTANEAYKADGEAYPAYFELRNQIISKTTFDSLNSEVVSGLVFIDGGITDPDKDVSISDYTSYGPNNEVYLAEGNAIAFDLSAEANANVLKKVQLAVKTVGGSADLEVYTVKADGTKDDTLNVSVNSATDMYYDITEMNGKTVVIKNNDGAIISITNVKATGEEAVRMMFSIRRSTANLVLESFDVEDDTVTDIPETGNPSTDTPTGGNTSTDTDTTDKPVVDDTVIDNETDKPVVDDTVKDEDTTDKPVVDDNVTDTPDTDDTISDSTGSESFITIIINAIIAFISRLFGFFGGLFN